MTKKLKKTYFTTPDIPDRIDAYISAEFEELSRNTVKTAVKNGLVLVNGEKVKPSFRLQDGDVIEIFTDDYADPVIIPENIPLDIRYEDENMLIVNKPKNMLSHPTSKELSGTLVNALLYRYGYNGLSDINGSMRPGILHRLDRNTSGLLMIAKNNAAHENLANQIKTKTAKRNYLAVVSGVFDSLSGTITADIGRHKTKPEKYTVCENGKPSVTHYKVLEQFKNFAFIELELETGRTHQIRVHLSYIGHAIVNDSLYGGQNIKVKTTEQVLQAYKLSFLNPASSERINIEISPDNDIIRVLSKLRSER